MKLEVGMYVRTKGGEIHKVTDIRPFYENNKLIYDEQYLYLDNKYSGYKIWQFQEYVLKASHNIKDLIEDGDYVNGEKVWDYEGKLYAGDYEYGEYLEKFEEWGIKIETIVTKEQFESMSYKVGDVK